MSGEASPGRFAHRWTRRQRQVLDLLVSGKSNAEVAAALGISVDGAKWHMREILSKLDVDTREEAAEYWRRANGWPARLWRTLGWIGNAGLVRLGAATIVTAAAFAGLLIVVAMSRDTDTSDPPPPAPSAASESAAATVVPTPPVYRAALAGHVLSFGANELIVEDGESKPRVVTTSDTTVTKAEGAPSFQAVTAPGLARLRVGDSVSISGAWVGTALIRADAICANCWIHRPALIAGMGASTIGLRIQPGPGAAFPDSATEVHIDPRLVSWPQTSLGLGERVEFEAAQADDGTLVLVSLTR